MKMYYETFGKKHWIRVPNNDVEIVEKIFELADRLLGGNIITNIRVTEDIFNGKEN